MRQTMGPVRQNLDLWGQSPTRRRIELERVPPTSIATRTHEDGHLLLWQARGGATVLAGGARFTMRRGQALWVPRGVPHSVALAGHSVLLPVLLPARPGALEAPLDEVSLIDVGEDLATLLLADVQSQMSVLGPEIDLTHQILTLVERGRHLNAYPPMPTSSAAALVAGAWRRDPADVRGLGELARSAHVSVRTIERHFLDETGLTARTWRLTNRMEAAAVLLRTSMTVAAVGRRVGYADAGAFGRAFRNHFGTTPGRYAAQRRHEEVIGVNAPG